jgi:hypothetical protein
MGSTVAFAGPALFVLSAAGIVWRTSDSIALLFEVQSAVPIGPDVGEFNGAAFAPGIRLPHDNWALDIALDVPVSGEATGTPIPVLVFTYRF